MKKTFVVRDRLNTFFSNAHEFPMILLSAPMGYGKTVLTKQYLNSIDSDSIWITMHDPVNISAPEYFTYLCVETLKERYPGLQNQLDGIAFPYDSRDASNLIRLISKSLDDRLTVVIDDYHLIENEETNRLIERLARAEIHGLQIILISRKLPNMLVSEMSIKGYCKCLKSEDIIFTRQELDSFFDLILLKDTDEIRDRIWHASKGWIAAAYLMASNYIRYGSVDGDYTVNSLVKKVFFNDYPNNIQTLIIQLSFLRQPIPPSLITHALGPEALETLEILSRDNLFIFADHNGNYHIHDLYFQFIEDMSQSYVIDKTSLFSRCAQWYRDNGLPFQAIQLWASCGNISSLLEEVENVDMGLFSSQNRAMLYQIQKDIPVERMYEYPMALIKYVFWITMCVDRERGLRMIEQAIEYYSKHSNPRYTLSRILGEINVASTAIAFGDAKGMSSYVQKAKEYLKNETSLIRTKNNNMTDGSPHFTFYYLHDPGTFAEITDIISTNYVVHAEVTGGCGAGMEYLAVAEYCLETYKWDDVEMLCQKAMVKARMYSQICIEVCALMTLGRLYIAQDDERLSEVLEGIHLFKERPLTPINMNVVDTAIGYLRACLGEYDKIPDWLRCGDSSEYCSLYNAAPFKLIVHLMAVFLTGDIYRLDVLCDDYFSRFSDNRCLLGCIYTMIFKALSQSELHGGNEWVPYMRKALVFAMPDEIIMPFIDNICYVRRLIIGMRYDEELKSFCNTVLDAADSGIKVLFSRRETEIMEHMLKGASRKEIAQKLFISVNTVKRHIQNIYAKLGANNKTVAINKYREYRGGRTAGNN